MASEKGRISRRRFVKYFVGLGAALAAAAVGFRLVTRRGAEEATRTTLPPAETTEAPKTTKPTPPTTEPPKPPSGEGFADMILMNGNILTVDPNDRVVNAVAVKEKKIQATGSYEDLKHFVGSSTRNIDLQGKTVTPGLVDSHIHVHYYGKQFQDKLVNIRYPIVKTKGDLVGKIRERLKLVGEGEWVAGNQGFFIANPPDRLELDEMAQSILCFYFTARVSSPSRTVRH